MHNLFILAYLAPGSTNQVFLDGHDLLPDDPRGSAEPVTWSISSCRVKINAIELQASNAAGKLSRIKAGRELSQGVKPSSRSIPVNLTSKQEKGFISTSKASATANPTQVSPGMIDWAKRFLKNILKSFLMRNRPIVMCVPRGGLNDMLCQIHHCRQYARAHGRVLIVNSIKWGMRDVLSNYFETWLPDPMLCLNTDSTSRAKPGNEDCFPLELCGRAYSYTSAFSEQLNFYDEKSGTPLRFNTSQAYSQKLLIHEQCGGGTDGWKALENLRLTSEIRSKVLSKLQNLPTSYIGVHIRHSDVTTNYVGFFDLISTEIHNKVVLVCSDSYQVLSHAKKVLPAHQVITISDIPDNGGMPLHDHASIQPSKPTLIFSSIFFPLPWPLRS